MKKLPIIFLLLTVSMGYGQSTSTDFYDLIRSIADRSVSMRALSGQFKVDSLAARRGLNPEDPEVAVDYFFENSAEMRIEQSFDFPTAYVQRSKISKLSIERSSLELDGARRALIIEISDLYLTALYQQQFQKMIYDRQTMLSKFTAATARQVELGEATALDLINAQSMLSDVESQAAIATSDLEATIKSLRMHNAGQPVVIAEQLTPSGRISISQTEFVEAAMNSDYGLQASVTDSMIAQRTLRLSRAEWLPKIKVGYRLDAETGSARSAVVGGISLPLWQNRGNIKHSKAMISSAEIQKQTTQQRLRLTLENLYSQYEALKIARAAFPDDDARYAELLEKSYVGRSITALEFLRSSAERYDVQQRRLDIENQLLKAQAMISLLVK